MSDISINGFNDSHYPVDMQIDRCLDYFKKIFPSIDKDKSLKEKIKEFHFIESRFSFNGSNEKERSNYALCTMAAVAGLYLQVIDNVINSDLHDPTFIKAANVFKDRFTTLNEQSGKHSIKLDILTHPEEIKNIMDAYMDSSESNKILSDDEYKTLNNPHELLLLTETYFIPIRNKILQGFQDENNMEEVLSLFHTPRGACAMDLVTDPIYYSVTDSTNYGPPSVIQTKKKEITVSVFKEILEEYNLDIQKQENLAAGIYGKFIDKNFANKSNTEQDAISNLIKVKSKEVLALHVLNSVNGIESRIYSVEMLDSLLSSNAVKDTAKEIKHQDLESSLDQAVNFAEKHYKSSEIRHELDKTQNIPLSSPQIVKTFKQSQGIV